MTDSAGNYAEKLDNAEQQQPTNKPMEQAKLVPTYDKSKKPKQPTKYVSPDTMANNVLQDDVITPKGEKERKLNLPIFGEGKSARAKNGEIITTSLICTYDQTEGVEMRRSITEFQRHVFNVLCSFWLYGDPDRLISSKSICRALTNNHNLNPSPQQVGAVTKAIEVLRRIYVKIDAIAEFERRGIVDERGKPATYIAGDFMISVTDIAIRANGKIATGYKLNICPHLLNYSLLTGQLFTINADLLDISRVDTEGRIHESLQTNEKRIAIVSYLLRRLEIMKRDLRGAPKRYSRYLAIRKRKPHLPERPLSYFYQQMHRIRLDAIFKNANIEIKHRPEKQRLTEYIFNCFAYWQAKGHIFGYSKILDEDGKLYAVAVQLEKQEALPQNS